MRPPLKKCDSCDALPTHSVTDAIHVIHDEWTESEPRFGCKDHPVRVRFVTAERTYTLEEWEARPL